MAADLPVTILGGYLGAGKTTLVNHLLREAKGGEGRGRRVAVLVNEFGALPIDADLIEGADGNLLALAGGCICCSYGDDLIAALMDLANRCDRIDHILIEASGVALPGAIARTLSLLQGLTHEATFVLVDAEQVRARAADRYIGDTITRQLADADLVIINKCDLVTSDARAHTRSWLAGVAPTAGVIEATHAQVRADVALGIDGTRLYRAVTETRPHDLREVDAVELLVPHRVDVGRLAASLTDPDLALVRAKGFVEDTDGVWHSVQLVGPRITIAPAPAGITAPARLVCIAHGRRVPTSRVRALIAKSRVT